MKINNIYLAKEIKLEDYIFIYTVVRLKLNFYKKALYIEKNMLLII